MRETQRRENSETVQGTKLNHLQRLKKISGKQRKALIKKELEGKKFSYKVKAKRGNLQKG